MSALAQAPPPARAGDVELMGVPFRPLSEDEAIAYMLDALDRGEGGWLVNPNLDGLRQWVTNPDVAGICRRATLVLADGMAVVWASRLQGTPLPGRVAGSNLIFSLSEAAARRGRSIFLLGGDPGTADAAADVLRARAPHLRVVGTHCPPHGFEREPLEMDAIRALLLARRPDIVYVALGLPKQEHLIDKLRPLLPRAWFMGIGISFSFVCGRVKRAPLWMQNAGLEWLHRLVQEPRRLGKRYLVEGLPFALRLAANCTGRRLRPARGSGESAAGS